MATYLTNQDLIDRVGNNAAIELTTESGETPDADVLTEVGNSAQGEADGYLARRYAVPVDLTTHTDLAAVLKGFVLDIAAYRLHARRPPVADAIRRARDDAIDWLKAVSKGEIVLPAAVTPASTSADSPVASYGGSPSISSRENMGVGPTE